jgi:adenylate cyclase
MAGRHLKTLDAVVMSGLWGASVYFAHERGHLRFLDLIESTMTGLRTLVRGMKMILFGLPQAAPDDAAKATQCATMLCVSAEGWLASLPESIRSRLGLKVGAHFGIIVASRLGGGSYHHITATGDTVNIANRLMEVADRHGVELAVSDELFSVGGRGSPLVEAGTLTGPVETRVRGRSGLLDVWLWRTSSADS